MIYHFYIILILLLKTFESAVPDNDGEANIIKAIMTKYNSAIRYFDIFFSGVFLKKFEGEFLKLLRPDYKIEISMQMSLRALSSVDEKNSIITTDSYFTAEWTDTRLIWDPTNVNYGDNQYVFIPASSLWMPDFCELSTVNTNCFVSLTNYYAFVQFNGTVYVSFFLSGF